jgi:hypothetical protein
MRNKITLYVTFKLIENNYVVFYSEYITFCMGCTVEYVVSLLTASSQAAGPCFSLSEMREKHSKRKEKKGNFKER